MHRLQIHSGHPTEKVDRSKNCNTAADALCGTQADYLFGFLVAGCTYPAGGITAATDPDGDVVNPMEHNTMSYFTGCADYEFTQDQKDAIALDIQHPLRNYVNQGTVPNHDVIDGAPSIVKPVDGKLFSNYNDIEFLWSDVNGASKYLFEIATFPNLKINLQEYIINENTITLTLDPDQKYYWRVTPFNNGNVCTESTLTYDFTTGDISAIKEVSDINTWGVTPNPTHAAEGLDC